MAFTPDGSLAFIQTCATPHEGSIQSYARASSGMLTATAFYSIANCVNVRAVSSDGKYLASGQDDEVQVYSLASDGPLTSILARSFSVTVCQQANEFAVITDMVWDQSGAFLLVGVTAPDMLTTVAVAVLGFSGSSLSRTVDPTGGGIGRIQRTGSVVYGMKVCDTLGCIGPFGILGFAFQNGQVIPLPGSPHTYGNGGDMVMY